MKYGLLIFVLHVHVGQDLSIVSRYNVRLIHIVVICINQKMNVVLNVEVNYYYITKKRNICIFKNKVV